MKSKYILAMLLGVILAAGAYTIVIYPGSSKGIGASLFQLGAIQTRTAPIITIPTPTPASQNACQNSGASSFSSPVSNASYTSGSYLPVAWIINSAAAPTAVTLTLIPQGGGAGIVFSQYTSSPIHTTNGTITATMTRGGDAAGVIPASVAAGQYYMQLTMTVNGSTGISCSPTFTIAPPPLCISPTSYPFSLKWGILGSGNGQLSSPSAVAIDPSGNIYVADSGNHRIEKFNSSGTYLLQWGSLGTGNGQFSNGTIAGLAIDSAGNVYVTDSFHIKKFTSSGVYVTQWGTSGNGNGQFIVPVGIAIDSNNNVYVLDAWTDKVSKFTSSGTFVTSWIVPGNTSGSSSGPQGIAVSAAGEVYVADTNRQKVQEFTSVGTHVRNWGTTGSGNSQFMFPRGISVDSSGNVFVSDTGNNNVQKFTSSGSFLLKWGTSGSSNGQFSVPTDVEVDRSGNVYISDQNNSRIQKFAPMCVQS